MDKKEVVVHRGSIELVVIGLLAALVVLLAFPVISGVTGPREQPASQQLDVAEKILLVE